jgi:hypothetical protein
MRECVRKQMGNGEKGKVRDISCHCGTATKHSMFMSLNVASLNVIVSKRKSFKT